MNCGRGREREGAGRGGVGSFRDCVNGVGGGFRGKGAGFIQILCEWSAGWVQGHGLG